MRKPSGKVALESIGQLVWTCAGSGDWFDRSRTCLFADTCYRKHGIRMLTYAYACSSICGGCCVERRPWCW